jgi:hypothetical protein
MNRFHFFDENVMWQAENSEKNAGRTLLWHQRDQRIKRSPALKKNE